MSSPRKPAFWRGLGHRIAAKFFTFRELKKIWKSYQKGPPENSVWKPVFSSKVSDSLFVHGFLGFVSPAWTEIGAWRREIQRTKEKVFHFKRRKNHSGQKTPPNQLVKTPQQKNPRCVNLNDPTRNSTQPVVASMVWRYRSPLKSHAPMTSGHPVKNSQKSSDGSFFWMFWSCILTEWL